MRDEANFHFPGFSPRLGELIRQDWGDGHWPKEKAPNRCAWLGAQKRVFFARVPGGKPARANHILG